MDKIGLKLRKERERAGLSVRALAKEAGVDHVTVLNIETGSLPTVRTLAKLAKFFKMPVTYFLE